MLIMGFSEICHLSSSLFRAPEKFLKLKVFKCIFIKYLVTGCFLFFYLAPLGILIVTAAQN